MNWHSGWSQPTFFEIDGAFIMPRPKVSSVEMTLTRRIDWLLAGRLMRLFDQSDASAAENWVLNLLFVGSEPMSVLWYDGSTDPMDVVTRGCDVLRKAGHQNAESWTVRSVPPVTMAFEEELREAGGDKHVPPPLAVPNVSYDGPAAALAAFPVRPRLRCVFRLSRRSLAVFSEPRRFGTRRSRRDDHTLSL